MLVDPPREGMKQAVPLLAELVEMGQVALLPGETVRAAPLRAVLAQKEALEPKELMVPLASRGLLELSGQPAPRALKVSLGQVVPPSPVVVERMETCRVVVERMVPCQVVVASRVVR